ncbi:MAG: LuxR family transcriptional regulator [Hymenobacter sp.]|nr:MAG: LuxR family transcriptional regulator [Hymenobacter sp.]
MGLAIPLHPDNHFAAKVQRLIDENDFLRQHSATFSRLTVREREILARLSRSQSSMEIADALFISEQTVNTHRRNLRQKLGATTAFELGQYARAFDLI